jgi:hypothetical protein
VDDALEDREDVGTLLHKLINTLHIKRVDRKALASLGMPDKRPISGTSGLERHIRRNRAFQK